MTKCLKVSVPHLLHFLFLVWLQQRKPRHGCTSVGWTHTNDMSQDEINNYTKLYRRSFFSIFLKHALKNWRIFKRIYHSKNFLLLWNEWDPWHSNPQVSGLPYLLVHICSGRNYEKHARQFHVAKCSYVACSDKMFIFTIAISAITNQDACFRLISRKWRVRIWSETPINLIEIIRDSSQFIHANDGVRKIKMYYDHFLTITFDFTEWGYATSFKVT
jgi:hypothetical protein